MRLSVAVVALAFAACAGPSKNLPAAGQEAGTGDGAAQPKFKKKPRMNGRGELSSISLEEFFALQQSGEALIYDARPAFFYQLGHVPGALNLAVANCDEKINARESEIKGALAAGKTIVVYCTSLTCPDARSVAMHLSGFGYPAKIFSGGWDAWKDAGMPTE